MTGLLQTAPREPESHTARAHPGRMPGEIGTWVLVLGEMSVFGILFVAYLYSRGGDPGLYNHAQGLLTVDIAVINTLVLLLSSLFVVRATRALRAGRNAIAAKLFSGAVACGLVFGTLKVVEYSRLSSEGMELTTNDFTQWFFSLTGYHLYHLVVGTGFLAYLAWKARASTRWGPKQLAFAESCAIFWHMVDLLWIVLFPLLYLVK